MIRLSLTPDQQRALPGVKWVLRSGPRGVGKSELLAHALIQTAIEELGRDIYVFDHNVVQGTPSGMSACLIWGKVRRIVRTNYNQEYTFTFNEDHRSIRCTGRINND